MHEATEVLFENFTLYTVRPSKFHYLGSMLLVACVLDYQKSHRIPSILRQVHEREPMAAYDAQLS